MTQGRNSDEGYAMTIAADSCCKMPVCVLETRNLKGMRALMERRCRGKILPGRCSRRVLPVSTGPLETRTYLRRHCWKIQEPMDSQLQPVPLEVERIEEVPEQEQCTGNWPLVAWTPKLQDRIGSDPDLGGSPRQCCCLGYLVRYSG